MKTKNFITLIFTVLAVLISCKKPDKKIKSDFDIMINGKIVEGSGIGMGVDDSQHLCNWVTDDTLCMRMSYPGNLDWGAVFFTVGGDPTDPPSHFDDISKCTSIQIEMKSKNDSDEVSIGLKDRKDPSDGSEDKKNEILTQSFKTYTYSLSDFSTCNLKQIYVIPEFVFSGNSASIVYVKSIKILK
jgi:hypothetical protein